MSNYAEYLKSLGATEEEVKILDSPVARRAFDKSQADAEEARAAAAKLEETMKNYETRVNQWYTENDSKLKQVQNQAIASAAEAARAKAALLEANRQGLIDVAKDLNYEVDPPKAAAPAAPDDRYVSKQDFGNLMSDAGASLARMADLKDEYASLFPGQRLNLSSLVAESKANGAPDVFSYAEKKFNLPAAREAAAKKARDEEIAKWKQEGAKEKETELISRLGNPELRPLVPSKSPFAVRPDDKLRADNQPWNKSETQLQNDRITRASQKLMERQTSGLN